MAFSAKRSQFEAGSTTTVSIIRPITPPLALISSTAIITVSRNDTSLMAMVPLRECKMPILIGSLPAAYDRAQLPKLPSRAATPMPAATLLP